MRLVVHQHSKIPKVFLEHQQNCDYLCFCVQTGLISRGQLVNFSIFLRFRLGQLVLDHTYKTAEAFLQK